MKKKSLISQYISEYSTSQVRSRANRIKISEIEYDETSTHVIAKVLGSRGNRYQVKISNLNSNKISSACSCPYDWGGICKHQVAVLRLIEKGGDILQYLKPKKVSVKSKERKKYSKVAPYVIAEFKLLIDDDLIDRHARRSYNYYPSINPNDVALTADKIVISMADGERYWNDSLTTTQIELKDNDLILTCECEATNQFLCKHQFEAMNFISCQISPHLFDKAYLKGQWKKELKRYGYSLKDNYQKNFAHYFEEGVFKIKPTIEGLIPAVESKELQLFANKLTTQSSLKGFLLSKRQTKSLSKLILAIGIGFGDSDMGLPIYTKLLTGKPNKSGEITSRIREVLNLEDVSEVDQSLDMAIKTYQLVSSLFMDKVGSLAALNELSDTDLSRDSQLLSRLSKMIAELDEDIRVYKLIEDYYTYKLTRKNLQPIKLNVQSTSIKLLFTEEEEFYKLECYVLIETKKIKIPNKRVDNTHFFAIVDGEYYLHKSVDYIRAFNYFMNVPTQRIQKSELENYMSNFLMPLQKSFDVMIDIPSISTERKEIKETNLSKRVYLSEVNEFVAFEPIIATQDRLLGLYENCDFTTKSNGVITYHYVNDRFIKEFQHELQAMHPEFISQKQNNGLYLSFEQFGKDRWFLDAFEIFKRNNIEVFGYDQFKKLKYNVNKPSINVGVSSEIDWFDVKIAVSFGAQILPMSSVKRAVLKQEAYVKLGDGSYGYLPEEWIKKMERYFRYGAVNENSVNISKHHFSLIEELFDEIDDEDLFQEIEEKKNKLIAFESIKDVKKPRGITAKLRAYQAHGFSWLNFLNEFGMGGCLADDMGLGKTLQVICILQHQKNKKIKKPSLVVVPTSLIFNWQDEVAKFAPKLRLKVISGVNRNKNTKDFKKYDIILITYGLVLRDIDYLKEYHFNYAILDESQAIKNPNSKRYKSVRLLQADNKLVMTGTPVENSTMDLYSQMSFANPGLLGSATFFKDYFAKAIEKDKDEMRTEELKKLIKPFLIRRTKEQVATELPEKTEMTLFCEFEPAQQKVYDAFRDKYKNYLLGKIDEEGIGKSKMYVLEGLLKLRQICNSPALLNDKEDYGEESIKIKELLIHINEHTGKHKILVFSQFVKMLHLIKNALEKEGIAYEYLDGKTKNRQEKVNNFQYNDKIRVFLISLKAGGTGLNLTSADYVYIVDPWWNPAVEAQAIDRCYRIGQDKQVMAYKMICKGTVEEKIVELQQRKMKMVKDIVSTDDSILKSLTKSDIENLFS